ncbi:hypothetical protein ULF88_15770 [Halopseudomonas pachastrellae]|nr:hypothetical protein [Halopseudomonas pachastrellae]
MWWSSIAATTAGCWSSGVEGFCDAPDWQRAYGEINDFEQQLSDSGTLVIKFWLAITEEEQLKRFKAREHSPVKRYKLTDEDWRNRKRWPDYVCRR